MKRTLRRQLTSTIVLTVLIAVSFVSLFSSFIIHDHFKDYIEVKQTQTLTQIVAQIAQQYEVEEERWDVDTIHEIGMVALYSGYIIHVNDHLGRLVWDAELEDMSACVSIADDVTERMLKQFPSQNGSFSDNPYPLTVQDEIIGTVNIRHYGPVFYSIEDERFINQVQQMLWIIALSSILLSSFVGLHLAKSLSRPITKSIKQTATIAEGNYGGQIEDESTIDEVRSLIAAVNHLSTTLADQDRLKKQLTSDVAHELRTPLSTLEISMEAARDGILPMDQKRMQSLLDEVQRLSKIVKNLDQLNRIEEIQRLNISPFDLGALLKDVVAALEIQAESKSIKITLSGEQIQMHGDRDRLNQVFYNLVLNALNYSNPNANIEIRWKQTSDTAQIIIKDEGIGIPEKDIPYIFDRFYRVESARDRIRGGSGIGLTIVKRFIEAHKGSIKVVSEENTGTTFTITLPLQSS